MFRIRHTLLLGLIFCFAIILRFIPIIYLEWKEPGWHEKNVNEVEFYYDDVARSLIAGKGFVHSVNPRSPDSPYKFKPGTPFHFVPPLYAWWLYLVYLVFGPNVFIAKILQSTLDAIVCLMLYSIGKRIFHDSKIGLFASLLYAIYPLAIVMCNTLYYQIPMNVIVCWMILCYMASITLRNGIWTGISVAASALAKPVTLPLIICMPIVRIVESWFKKSLLKPSFLWSISFIVAGSLTLAPWTIRNYMVFHKFVPVQHGGDVAFHQGSKEEYIDLDVNSLRKKYGDFGLKQDEINKAAISNHLMHFRSNPLDYLRFLGKKFLLSWFNTEGKQKNFYVLLVQIPFLAFALISLIFSLKFWLKTPNWYIPALVLYICGIQVVIFPLVRYTLVVMPLVMLMTASGLNIVVTRYLGFRGKAGQLNFDLKLSDSKVSE